MHCNTPNKRRGAGYHEVKRPDNLCSVQRNSNVIPTSSSFDGDRATEKALLSSIGTH